MVLARFMTNSPSSSLPLCLASDDAGRVSESGDELHRALTRKEEGDSENGNEGLAAFSSTFSTVFVCGFGRRQQSTHCELLTPHGSLLFAVSLYISPHSPFSTRPCPLGYLFADRFGCGEDTALCFWMGVPPRTWAAKLTAQMTETAEIHLARCLPLAQRRSSLPPHSSPTSLPSAKPATL
jgi:hypothetical protein